MVSLKRWPPELPVYRVKTHFGCIDVLSICVEPMALHIKGKEEPVNAYGVTHRLLQADFV